MSAVRALLLLRGVLAPPPVQGKAVHGNSALHAAVQCHSAAGEAVAKALLAAGARQDVKNVKGTTPAGLAGELGKDSIRKLLAKSLAGGTLAKMTQRAR